MNTSRNIKKEDGMVMLWNSGVKNMHQIGKKYHVSRERVRQILHRRRAEGQTVLSVLEWKVVNSSM